MKYVVLLFFPVFSGKYQYFTLSWKFKYIVPSFFSNCYFFDWNRRSIDLEMQILPHCKWNKLFLSQIIRLDARNHGNSPHSEDMSYEAMSYDVLKVMDNMKIEKACLMGHSMGGKAFMTTALLHVRHTSFIFISIIFLLRYMYHQTSMFLKQYKCIYMCQKQDHNVWYLICTTGIPIRITLLFQSTGWNI